MNVSSYDKEKHFGVVVLNQDKLDLLRSQIIGVEQKVPIRTRPGHSGMRNYINFDNAATTPPLKAVVLALEAFLPWYSSIHRGFGFKSQLSTDLYARIRTYVTRFLGGSTKDYTAIFVKNATEALNKLSYKIPRRELILTTLMEHHSNDLPWRTRHQTAFVRLTKEGVLDLNDLETKLRGSRIGLVTVSGASNVTGVINPIYTIAEMAHHYGAKLSVDAAQLLPHRPVTLKKRHTHLDFLSFSGHKIYAPYGSGVLIGDRSLLMQGYPEHLGGGTVISVSEDDFTLSPLPDRDEAGTPNLIGAYTLAQALRWLEKQNFPMLCAYEEELTVYAYRRLQKIPGLILYGPPPTKHPRVGVITFNISGLPHGLTASALAYEGGIGVRHGCFCARPYVHHLLGLNQEEIRHYESLAGKGPEQKNNLPGLVRISFGFYNTRQEVDCLVESVKYIVENKNKIRKEYIIDDKTGEYKPGYGVEQFTVKLNELLTELF